MLRILFSAVALAAFSFASIPAHAGGDWVSAGDRAIWDGLYVGANGGYGWNNGHGSNITIFDPANVPYATGPLPYNLDLSGGFGGGQIGYNHSLGALVVGIEADIQGADIDGSSSSAFSPPQVFPFTYDASQQLDWFATVRGRVGIDLCGGTLVYVTGGYAFGRAEYDATYLIPQNGASATLHANNFQDGYVLGGGIEHQLSRNWSLKIEYQYLDLGDGNVSGPLNFANGRPSGETVATRYDVDLQTVRVGLNYRFDDQEPPMQPLK